MQCGCKRASQSSPTVERPLLKKRRLSGGETRRLSTLPSPRPLPRRPLLTTPDSNSSLTIPFPQSISPPPTAPLFALSDCLPAYCTQCLAAQSSPLLARALSSLQRTEALVLQHRLNLSQCIGRRSSPEVSQFYELACSSPLLRCQIVGFLVHCQRKLPSPLSPNTFHLGLSIFDRFLLKNAHLPQLQPALPKIAGAALIIASKMEDVWALHVDDLILSGGHQFTSAEILHWEVQVLQSLDFDLSWPTAFFFLTEFVRQGVDLAAHQRTLDHQLPSSAHCCRCRCCQICGVVSNIDRRPFLLFEKLGAQNWDPKFREGRGLLAIHACALYILDILLCHPESLRWDPTWTATISLVIALDVINKHSTYTTTDLLPPLARSHTCAEGFVESLAAGVAVVDEHLAGLEAARYLDEPAPQQQDGHFREAMAERDPKERLVKFTVYFMLKASREGKKLSVTEARQMATKWMEEIPIDNQDIAHPMAPSHFVITEQKPKQNESLLPLGRFALDIYAKHRDAAELFVPLFREWIEKGRTVEWTTHLSQSHIESSLGLDEVYETQGHLKLRTRSKSLAPGTPAGPLKRRPTRKRRLSCPPESNRDPVEASTRGPHLSKTPIGTKPVKPVRKSLNDFSGRDTGSTVASIHS